MNSKSSNSGNTAGNKDQARYSAAEAQEQVVENTPAESSKHRASETANEPEVIITDKRRFTAEGEVMPIENWQGSEENLTAGQTVDSAEIELLNSKLKESEEKRLE